MAYKVKKQYGRGPEIFCESFKQLADAKKYVDEKLAEEAAMSVNVVYKIYDAIDEIVEEFDSNTYKPAPSSSEQGSQSAGQSAGSRPTPLATAPRPPGMPQSWRTDEDKKKDK